MDFAEIAPPESLARLFDGDRFRFGFNLRSGGGGWFDTSTSAPERLRERVAAVGSPEAPGMAWTPAADAAWQSFAGWATGSLGIGRDGNPRTEAEELARRWAPDFLLLDRAGDSDPLRFHGGAVCFPTGWDPAEKLGRTVAEIHGIVPTLNAELGARIDRFLGGLKPGEVVERENWGLAGSGELRMHPALGRRRLDSGSGVDDAWFRLEEQGFAAVPGGRVVVFMIHVRTWPLREVAALPGVGTGLARALESMPEGIAAYKGVASARGRLAAGLRVLAAE